MSTAIGTLAPEVTVGGTALASAWQQSLVSLRVERALGLVGRATLRFADDGYALSAASIFTLGNGVEIREPGGGRLLMGTVTGVTLTQSLSAAPELVVVVDDIAYKLTRGNPVDTYLKMSYTDAITRVAQEAGIAGLDVQAAGAVNEYLLKAGTAISFIDTITRRIGYAWWVDGDDGPGTLTVKKSGTSTGTVQLAFRESLLDFSLRASGLRPSIMHVNGWDRDSQQNIDAGVAGDDPPGLPRFVADYTKASSPLGAAPTSASTTNPEDDGEAHGLADALASDSIAAAVVARGRCYVDARIKPAVTAEVADAGPASGSYLITEVEHSYDRRGFFTRFVAGSPRPSGLVDTLGNPPPDPGFTISGLVVATVSNNVDEEKTGRVRVKFSGIKAEVESAWARMLSVGAGGSRGTVFLPEVGDEVLVGFENGDARRPVVLGSLYSKTNTLPSTGSGVGSSKVDYRRITSRLGHVIEMADGSGPTEQHLMLKLGNVAHKLRLGADAFDIEVAAGKPVTIKAGSAKFEISDSGDVTIEGNNITLKAKQAVTVQAQQKIGLKATGQLEAQGGMVKVAAEGVAEVQASGPLILKGAMVAIN